MYYRRKVILGLMEALGGEVEKIRLQKLLFLFCKQQKEPKFDFVPYKFGCFSFSANADLMTLVKKGTLTESDKEFSLNSNTQYFKMLTVADKKIVLETKDLYGKMSSLGLMKHTYINHPYYAIKSEIAEEILDTKYFEKIQNSKPLINDITLFTIGYEGASLENYFNRLLRQDIKALVDVRSNPLSRKYGFSKKQLKKTCEKLSIEYYHFPEVGIKSKYRQELNSQEDYDKLFVKYCENDLPTSVDAQKEILKLLIKYKRIALTCFEKNVCQCHRKPLSNAIKKLPEFNYQIKHI